MLHFELPQLSSCVPPFWLFNGHLQTILGYWISHKKTKYRRTRYRIALEDGDTLVVYLNQSRTDGDVVYLFHGLGGSIESNYIQRFAQVVRRMGHNVFMVNHRGCGQGAGLARKPYHMGRAEDASEVIAFGKKMFPQKQHIAVGFSMSGNILLLLAAGVKGKTLPDFVISVNAPINLYSTSEKLSKGFNRVYEKKFVQDIKQSIKIKYKNKLIKQNFKISNSAHLRDVDKIFTAPLSGFKDLDEYYTSCSSKRFLKEIQIPTVLITSRDDPFIDYKDYVTAHLSDKVHLHLEQYGGHLGYLNKFKTPLGDRRWIDYALYSYINAYLKEHSPRSWRAIDDEVDL